MKSIPKLVFLNALLIISFNHLDAQSFGNQPGMTPEERADRLTTSMSNQLSLSQAQIAKVKEANLIFANQLLQARRGNKGDRSKMRETMLAIRVEHNAEIKKYLTAEQFENWEKIETQQRAERRQRFLEKRGAKGKEGTENKEEGTQG